MIDQSEAYEPGPAVLSALHPKTLVMLVGPTAVGKSTLMNAVVERDDRFKRVSGVTTRAARSNDERGLYRYISEDKANTLIGQRRLVQYAVYPTTGVLYGTETQDYPGLINLLDTLSGAIESLRRLPFERTITISLCTDPEDWQGWLEQRFGEDNSEEKILRLQEAILSIEWSLAQSDDHYWLVNRHDEIDQAATELIRIVDGISKPIDRPQQSDAMLEYAREVIENNE